MYTAKSMTGLSGYRLFVLLAKEEDVMTDSVQRLQQAMLVKANNGDYNQDDAIADMTKQAAAGDRRAAARLRMLGEPVPQIACLVPKNTRTRTS
jgi:hypothetical protein